MISIVIATKNRSDFLTRLLQYYRDTNYKHWICIGDSSDSFHLEQTKKAIKFFGKSLKIKYHEYPNLNVAECHKKLLSSIQTSYTACVTDGGFLVTESLEKCLKFLDVHPSYSIAHGLGVIFELKQEGPYGQFRCLSEYDRLPQVEEETASLRLLHHLNNPSVTMYCVYRTSVWKAIWRDADSIKDGIFSGEVLPGCLTVIYGKAKQLNCLYLVRQIHNRRYLLANIYDWLTDPGWGQAYRVFHDLLVQAIVEQDGIDANQAQEVIKQAFWAHLIRGLNSKFQARYHTSFRSRLKRIPGLAQRVQVIKSLFPFSKRLSLPVLLNKNSPYYTDFIPIYKVVTALPEKRDNFMYQVDQANRRSDYVKR